MDAFGTLDVECEDDSSKLANDDIDDWFGAGNATDSKTSDGKTSSGASGYPNTTHPARVVGGGHGSMPANHKQVEQKSTMHW